MTAEKTESIMQEKTGCQHSFGNQAAAVLQKMQHTLTVPLFILTFLFLPFAYFPYGPFSRLSLYPLSLLFLLNANRLVKLCWTNKNLRFIGCGIVCWGIWGLLSAFCAIFNGNGEYSLVQEVIPVIRDGITLVCAYLLLAHYFLLPQDKVKTIFFTALSSVLVCCLLYSIVEILHFSGYSFATAFLKRSVHSFMTTCHDGTWWPPVLWNQPRLRSFFVEPSNFAILLGFALVYYVTFCQEKTRLTPLSIIFALLVWLFLCGTRSTAGGLTAVAASVVFALVYIIFLRKQERKTKLRNALIGGVLLIVSVSALFFMRGGFLTASLITNTILETKTLDSANEAQNQDQPRPTPQKPASHNNEGSIKTRTIHFYSALQLFRDAPLLGCGPCHYSDKMHATLAARSYQTHEIKFWLKLGRIPPLSTTMTILVKYGLPGVIFFFSFLLVPLFFLWKRIKSVPVTIFLTCGSLLAFICFFMVSSASMFLLLALMSYPVYLICRESPESQREFSPGV